MRKVLGIASEKQVLDDSGFITSLDVINKICYKFKSRTNNLLLTNESANILTVDDKVENRRTYKVIGRPRRKKKY